MASWNSSDAHFPQAVQTDARAKRQCLGAGTAECLYIHVALQAKVSAMGLLAQLFRHKDSPPREHATAPEPDANAGEAEACGVGVVAAQINLPDAVTAPLKIGPIPIAQPQPVQASATPDEAGTHATATPMISEPAPSAPKTPAPARFAMARGDDAPCGSPDAPDSAWHTFAPRLSLTATAVPVPTVLAPSVLPSAHDGGIRLAPPAR